MKPHALLLLCALGATAQAAPPQNHDAAVRQCIAENSGAGSVDCLKSIFWETQRTHARLEKALLGMLKKQRQADELTPTHHQLAVSSLADAARKFEAFRERQCDFALGASGSVASGAEQVRWQCRIRLNDWRTQYLQQLLGDG